MRLRAQIIDSALLTMFVCYYYLHKNSIRLEITYDNNDDNYLNMWNAWIEAIEMSVWGEGNRRILPMLSTDAVATATKKKMATSILFQAQ